MAQETFKVGDIVVLNYVRSPKMTVIDVDHTFDTQVPDIITVGWFDRNDDYHTAKHPAHALTLDPHARECEIFRKQREAQALIATL